MFLLLHQQRPNVLRPVGHLPLVHVIDIFFLFSLIKLYFLYNYIILCYK